MQTEQINMDELQDLKEQLSLLKSKLDKEAIVNDKLMREVTRQKVRRLNRNVWQEGLACLFVITFGNFSFYKMGLSWWFIGATTAMMIGCFLGTLIPHQRIRMEEIMNGNLLTVAHEVKHLKMIYNEWLKFGIPMVILWFGWFAYEVYTAMGEWKLAMAMIVGGFVGGISGGLVGWKMHKKLIQEMDDIINDIESA